MRTCIASFLFFVSSTCIAQVAPTASGDVLAYDVFNAKQGIFGTEITFQQNKEQRVLKLNIEGNGDRNYTLLNGRPFAIYDKSFVRTSNRGVAVSPTDYFVLLPKDKKADVGAKWEFSRSGTGSMCGDWKGDYLSEVKDGPETSISIDGKNSLIKTLLIEIGADILQSDSRCTTRTSKRVIHYAPELDEIVMDQTIDTEKKNLAGGYKLILKSITTGAGQAAK